MSGTRYPVRLWTSWVLVPLAVCLLLAYVLKQWGDFGLSPLIIATLSVLGRYCFSLYLQNYMKKRTADAAGWTLAPSVPGRSLFRILRLAEAVRKGYPGDIFLQWSATLGQVYEFGIGISTLLYTNEPIHIKELLVTQFDFFEKGPLLRSQLEALLGTGVFNSDGDMWKFHRIISCPFFTRKRIHDFQIYDRNCDASLKVAKERLREGYSIDFQDLVARFTLDSATEFLFGASVQSIAAGLSYPPSETAKNPSSFQLHPSNTFVKAFVEGQIQAAVRVGMGPLWPLGEIFKDKITLLRAVIDDFTDPFLKAALAEQENEVQREISDASLHLEKETLLAHLVKHTQDIRILKDEIVNLLVAGRDTTTCLLTFSMYMLTQHPDIERRLRQEIMEVVGPVDSPDHVHIRKMEYTRAFLNEVLRLYPPVPRNTRMANKSTTLPPAKAGEKPIYVPANTTCIYAVINMHRRTDLWGPDALDFDPDRFLDERLHKYLKPNPYIFCPFNAGPRVCLGQQFAYHEATFYLVRLLQNFTDFKLDDSANVRPPSEWVLGTGLKATEKIYPKCHLTMYVEGGLWISMKELQISKG